MLALLLASVAGASSPNDAQLLDAIVSCAKYATHPLPGLGVDERAKLLEGEVVRVVNRAQEGPSAAVGMALLKAPLRALWVAAQDPHATVDDSLTEFIVERIDRDKAYWYGYYDLPRPLKDRQWVVLSGNNHTMAKATADGCWEHSWQLVENGLERIRPNVEANAPNGITKEHLDRAIYTPVNHGSWFMAEVDDGHVFVAYQATTVVAGFIPDWVVRQLAMSRLETLMRSLEKRALTWSPGHYATGHTPPVYGGDGALVPGFDQ